MEDMLRHFVNSMEDEWDGYNAMVEFAYNDYWRRFVRTTTFVLNTCYQLVRLVGVESMLQEIL
jgi:hypothetical protein